MSNVSLAGGASVDLTSSGGALVGIQNATQVAAQVQAAIGAIETSNTGASSTPVRITAVQQVVIDQSSVNAGGTVDLTAIAPTTSSATPNTLVVVRVPDGAPSGTKLVVPSTIENAVVVLGGTNNVDVFATGTGGQSTVIVGNAGQNWLHGDAGDTLTGGSGNDTVGAFFGNVTADGGADNDLVYGNAGADTLIGGAGNDTLVGSVLGVTSGADSMVGGDGADLIIAASTGANIATGDAGNDSMVGGGGADNFQGGADADILLGMGGNDSLVGGDGNDNLQGGAGNDALVGGNGDDTLWGGAGTDTLTGGAGADIFYMRSLGAGSSQTVADFSGTDGDRLHFTGITTLTVAAGAPSATGTVANVALSGSNTVITMPDGSTITLVGITSLPNNSVIYT